MTAKKEAVAEKAKAAPKKKEAPKEPEAKKVSVLHEVAHVLAYPQHYTLGQLAKAQEALRELL